MNLHLRTRVRVQANHSAAYRRCDDPARAPRNLAATRRVSHASHRTCVRHTLTAPAPAPTSTNCAAPAHNNREPNYTRIRNNATNVYDTRHGLILANQCHTDTCTTLLVTKYVTDYDIAYVFTTFTSQSQTRGNKSLTASVKQRCGSMTEHKAKSVVNFELADVYNFVQMF